MNDPTDDTGETSDRQGPTSVSDLSDKPRYRSAREKFLGLSLESTRKSYYPQLQGQLTAVRKNERRLRLLADNLPAYISYVDAKRRFAFVNRQYEEAFGLRRDRIIGQELETILGTENYARVAHHVEQALEGRHVRFETPFHGPGGEEKRMEVQYVPDIDPQQGVIGFYDLTLDLTEQKMAEKTRANLEARLMQAQKMEAIGTLAGGIAHDFNNILSGIFGYTELLQLKSQEDDDNDSAKLLEGILGAARQARGLVQQILTFSRQASGDPEPIEMKAVVTEALKLVSSFLPSTITVRDVISLDCGMIMADRSQIHQIVMNLCTNAYHAMEESGGVLSVSLEEIELDGGELKDPSLAAGRYVQLRIADTGHGVAPENLDRIFEPYFTTKADGKGTGMGLAIIHGIVKNHGGQIYVASDAGRGTAFIVDLPVVRGASPKTDALDARAIRGGDETVLLVDDQQEVLEIMHYLLAALGYHVVPMTGSREALELFRSEPDRFDLVITDMTMPRMTGDRLAIEILAVRPRMPILLCTGFSERITPERVSELNICDVLMKPVALGDLAAAIRRAVKNDTTIGG